MIRRDFRTLKDFKKDIYYSTKIEEYLWNKFLLSDSHGFNIKEYYDYGVDNKGDYVERANDNPDYRLVYQYKGKKYDDLFEIKFAPNKTKLTFKVNNLQSYIKHKSKILLFYNTSDIDFRKRSDHNLKKQIKLLEANISSIKYGIITTNKILKMLDIYKVEKIYYMGNKPCIIVPCSDFDKFFTGVSL